MLISALPGRFLLLSITFPALSFCFALKDRPKGDFSILQDKTNESQGASESSKENETKDTQKKPKKRKITKDLVIESTVPELSQKELNTLIEKELELITQVKIEKDRSDAVNAVEEYVYQLRDDISGRYEPHVLEQVCLSFHGST